MRSIINLVESLYIAELQGHHNQTGDLVRKTLQAPMRRDALRLFSDFLKQKGFKTNSGQFGVVGIRADLPYVIKAFRNDRGYLRFVEYCQTHSNNKNLPVFRGKNMHIGENVFAVRMEILSPVPSSYDHLMYQLSAYADEYAEDQPEQWIEKRQWFSINDKKLALAQIGLFHTLHDLRNLLDDDIQFDLNDAYSNVMMRSDGNLVLTDPFYEPMAMPN